MNKTLTYNLSRYILINERRHYLGFPFDQDQERHLEQHISHCQKHPFSLKQEHNVEKHTAYYLELPFDLNDEHNLGHHTRHCLEHLFELNEEQTLERLYAQDVNWKSYFDMDLEHKQE
jgi:hypothetical protein